MTRRVLTILLAAAILAAAVPVYADGGADAEAQLEADLAAIMSEHGLDEGNIAFGYRRTTDWTQFTFNEDALFESASVYKLALNMYYYEQEAAGNIAPDAVYGGMPLSDCHRLSLQYSNNDLSRVMLDAAFNRKLPQCAAIQARLEQLEAQQRRDQEREYGMYRQTQVHFESLDSEVPHEDHP